MYVDTLVRLISIAAESVSCWLPAEPLCVSFPPDDHVDRLADWNQLLLCGGRTELLWEEGGGSPGQTEGDEWFDMTCVNQLSNFLQFHTNKYYILIHFQIAVDCDHSERLSGWCDCVAVHPLCVLHRREQHSTSEEITEEKFTRRQGGICSATQGTPAAPRHIQISKDITCGSVPFLLMKYSDIKT